MPKVVAVRVLQEYRLELRFDDSVCAQADLSDLVGKGVFSLWNDYSKFQDVRIGSSGELLWGDQVDLCPDSLYLRATGKKPEELFPSLRQEHSHA